MNILITGAGGAAAVSIVKALDGLPVKLFMGDIDPCAAGLYLVPAHQRAILARGDTPGYASSLLKLCVELDISLCIPTVDIELIPIADRREDYEAAGVRLMLSPKDALHRCLDKWAFFHSSSDSLPFPRTMLLTERCNLDNLMYPLIAKPRQGSGSRGIVLAHASQYIEHIPKDESYILQEYLPGAEYSVDVLVEGNGQFRAAVPRERMKVDSGIAVASRTVKDTELMRLGERAARLLGLRYVANIQFKRDEHGRPKLLEINPRFPGTMPLTVKAGINMPALCVREFLEGEMPRGPLNFEAMGVVRYWQEQFFPLDDLEALIERSEEKQELSVAR